MKQILRRNKFNFLVLFCVSASLILIIIKIINLDFENELLFEKKRIAMTENNERISQVKQICKKYKMGVFKTANRKVKFKESPAPQYNVFYIDKKHNISYCPIYKSGSTTWLHNLCLLNGITKVELSRNKEQISVIARKIMPALDYPEADELLNKTIKLLVVRHPFERLLSAYRDKLENSMSGVEHGTLYFYKKYGQRIARKYRKKSQASPRSDQMIHRAGVPKATGKEPTWREFVDYLIDTDLASYGDDHWMPYYLYCTPCLINYNFIAKVETLMRDQAFVIDQTELRHKIKPIWRHKLDDNNVAKIYFSQLTKQHVYQLYEKFKLDFELFGYSANRYYQFATSVT